MHSDGSSKETPGEGDHNVSDMALYDLFRASSVIQGLEEKQKWSLSDTASFDSMHYDGDAAIERCAAQLDLEAQQRVLDLGSGFNATGRFLASKYHVFVTGVELQKPIHELAEVVTSRNEDPFVVQAARSVNADFLTVTPEALGCGDDEAAFDHFVSFLCILHLPQDLRESLFRQAERFLKPGAKLYIEDFYKARDLTNQETQQLRETVSCPFLPTAAEYTTELRGTGFTDVDVHDISDHWKLLLQARAKDYRNTKDPKRSLEIFYDTTAELFETGAVRGCWITARKKD